MRILHTSDWHAGRIWKGTDRLGELARILDHLVGYIEREQIDLVLMTGDVYDSASPGADAERVVTTFFKRVGRSGVPSIIIAGNHDSPARIDTWGLLAELVNVTVRGVPRAAADGGLVEIATRCGHIARVAAVPFAPMGKLVDALTLARDETAARQQYASLMQRMFALLSEGFRADTVNLVMAHCDFSGAVRSGSERLVALGEDWAATPQSLPPLAQYVALGHIHCPQRMEAAAAPTEYAGSPMQLDFGEQREQKTFAVIDVDPGLPARVTRVPYEGGVELGAFEGTWAEMESHADALKRFGFLRVRLSLDAPDPDANRRVRKLLPNVVSVDVVHPDIEEPASDQPPPAAAPLEHFAAFYRREHQRDARRETLELFQEIYAVAGGGH